jgi:hypothetical protein
MSAALFSYPEFTGILQNNRINDSETKLMNHPFASGGVAKRNNLLKPSQLAGKKIQAMR